MGPVTKNEFVIVWTANEAAFMVVLMRPHAIGPKRAQLDIVWEHLGESRPIDGLT
jgi:hypothetical protein